ncbi:MAG: UDP-N-acetylmuramoyl-L-alanyl-D-glutamate--2,6-diaminopimelate ligase [Oscillospiraceae bacterium]|nr:UDP-N-acetylmuramoyl-L-alanyl-D-glutamate--2,6-diaminopimelate ligase [Oscillospiraceae bacterium]
MQLKNLLLKVEVLSFCGNPNIEISDIVYDSRRAFAGCVFVCLKGNSEDGHDFAKDAVKKGAVAVVASEKLDLEDIVVVYVENTRKSLAIMSAAFFSYPALELLTIAITGTKGKTTCAFMMQSILKFSSIRAATIGTVGVVFDDEIIKLNNTTPESYDVQKYLRAMVDRGYECAIIEVSSLGLKWHRVEGIFFDYGLFTNFSSDHIGENEHKNLREYLECKSMLFRQCRKGILNLDDENFNEILKDHTCEIVTFGFTKGVDFLASNSHLLSKSESLGVRFNLSGERNLVVDVSVPGKFSVYNALASIAVCCQLKNRIPDKAIILGLDKIKIRGRVEVVKTPFDYILMIDFAHNAISMKSILTTLREYKPSRLIVLFGSGGERSKVRRLEMGEMAGKFADFSILTSDNPRSENELDIIDDIRKSMDKTGGNYVVFPNRVDAINHCVRIAKRGDIIVLAGKGHEDYQYTKNGKEHFDEREIVAAALKRVINCTSQNDA